MQFEGERQFSQPRQQVWQKLRDARFLVHCVPDAEIIGEPTLENAQCKVRPGFAFVRGTLTITMTIAEAVEAETVAIQLASKGVGTSSDVAVKLTFHDQNGGTRIEWNAEVTRLGGLLKAVPKGLVRGAAQKTIDDLWHGIDEELEKESKI